MDHLGQISLENTVTVKIDYQLNQELLAKNFAIIMDCLKDLKSQQDKHTKDLSDLAGLKEMFDRFKEELKIKEEKEKENNNNNISGKESQNHTDSNNHSGNFDKTVIQSLQKQIDALKSRMTKNEGLTHDNTKHTNNLLTDMIDVKQEIQNLKKQLQNINTAKSSSQQGDRNRQKNNNVNQDVLKDLNKQAQQHNPMLLKFMKEMKDMEKHIKRLENDMEDLKNMQQQGLSNVNNNANSNNDGSNQNENMDQKVLSDLIKKVQFLTKKSENLQNQLQKNTKSIDELNDKTEKNEKEISISDKEVEKIHSELDRINKALEQLSKLKSSNSTGNTNNNNRSNDNSQLINEIQKLKEQYEKLLKLVNSMKTDKTDNNNGNETDRLSNSGKNINKLSQDRSFRKRSQSIDVTGRIRQLTERIKTLQKILTGNGDDNPQKLPSIGWKRPNQTSYNGQRSHKKQMSQMKNDLQIWVKSYLDNNMGKNGGNLGDLQLKIQQIRTNLAKKADHEGMKKGLTFLQGKITQLYLFLTEPQSEDAMIVRKGFNCLSCSKKVQSLRGKLGPRMNWDNLNSTHHNSMHTPPKAGFPKYNDSNERESI